MATAAQLSSDNSELFIAGYTSSSMDGNTNAGGNDAFVMKLNNVGVTQWTTQIGTTERDEAMALHVDSSGSIFVAGLTAGIVDGFSNLGGLDAFVMNLDSTGTKVWAIQTGSTSDDIPTAIECDASGNTIVAGYTTGGLDNNINAGSSDVFVLQIASGGFPITWVYQVGTSGNDVANDFTLDSFGNIYVAGYTEGELDGTAPYSYIAGQDLFVLKLDSSGAEQFIYQQGTTLDEGATAIQLDSADNVVIGGYGSGGLDGYLVVGGADLFIQNVDGVAGVHLWTRMLGTAGEAWPVARAQK